MSAPRGQSKTTNMPFAVRPLEEQDIAQSAEIERDAFPSLFPPTSFRRELKNRMASYLVVWRRGDSGEDETSVRPVDDDQPRGDNSPFLRLLLSAARVLRPIRGSTWQLGQQFIAGFVGTWYMVDEAHIVSVGVRREYRGHGLGELLLIGAIEQAMARRARVVTLEVRSSNHVARNLYRKYGFSDRGRRKGYYTDDGEDAMIMTTEPISLQSYREQFRGLVQGHEQCWGGAERVLA